MGEKTIIKDLDPEKLDRIRIKCLDCNFWFDFDEANFFEDLAKIRGIPEIGVFLKSKLFERTTKTSRCRNIESFLNYGGRVKTAFTGKKCTGILLAGKYYLFPKLKSFTVYPPDIKSVFLACIYVIPEYKETGTEKRLLIELEKDLIREKVEAIEAIGKRKNDDIDDEEFENSPLVPFKFLINNGFYLKKNNDLYPLVRLDIKSIAFDSLEEGSLIKEAGFKKRARSPVMMKQK
ncbi:MAG: hypothetical protein JW770_03425 [Actinobacteria bacterium]|nr:hypothetical protein [Actinomycetota bacterium]